MVRFVPSKTSFRKYLLLKHKEAKDRKKINLLLLAITTYRVQESQAGPRDYLEQAEHD